MQKNVLNTCGANNVKTSSKLKGFLVFLTNRIVIFEGFTIRVRFLERPFQR